MSIETKYICDVCGAVRGETNHWFKMGQLKGYASGYRALISLFDCRIEEQIEGRVQHLCGQKCAHALLDRWLTTGKLEAEVWTPTDAAVVDKVSAD